MLKRCLVSVFIFFNVFAFLVTPESGGYILYQNIPEGRPLVFEYGWRGLLLGGLTGLSAGYVRYAGENDTDNILRSVAYGTLIGAGVGLIAGFADSASEQRGMGDIILTDMTLGGWFGLAVGAIYGGILTISTGDWRTVGDSAAWGHLSGVLLGLGVGIYEGPQILGERQTTAKHLVPAIIAFEDSQKNLIPALKLSYRY